MSKSVHVGISKESFDGLCPCDLMVSVELIISEEQVQLAVDENLEYALCPPMLRINISECFNGKLTVEYNYDICDIEWYPVRRNRYYVNGNEVVLDDYVLCNKTRHIMKLKAIEMASIYCLENYD